MLKNASFSLFLKANLLLTILFFIAFLWHYQTYGFINFAFALIATISSATILWLVLYLILLPFSFFKKWILGIGSLLFILTFLALVANFFIYKLFHFHINAMVLNILTSPDAQDSVQTGIAPFIFSSIFVLFLIALEWYIIKVIHKKSNQEQTALNQKLNKLLILPLFLIILIEKVTFGMGSLFSNHTLIAPIKVIPLYQPLTFTKVASKYFGFKAEAQAKYSVSTHAQLNYPIKPIVLKQENDSFPIFIIASDSVKYSILSPELTPNITAFSKDALVFEHHYSGGNSTRFGIFSLIYGLNATYWFSFLNAHQKPVLFDVLKKRNYTIDIISSTNTNWPEFRKSCYVDIQEHIHDHFKGKPWKKDAQSTQVFLDTLAKYDEKKPPFTFLFWDSPHGYSYPVKENIFNAPSDDINYMTLTAQSKELSATVKKYKNAVHYNDRLFGKLIQALKAKGLYEKSLILYTSDHGQEFFEYGNFGHNTAFSKGQIHVPLMVKLPQALEGTGLGKAINSSLSSHQDIVPTLLTLLGVQNPPSEYSNGRDMLAPNFHRDYIFSANWNNNAIVTRELSSVFSNLPNKIFNNEVRETKSYQEVDAQTKTQFILDTINENKKFLK